MPASRPTDRPTVGCYIGSAIKRARSQSICLRGCVCTQAKPQTATMPLTARGNAEATSPVVMGN